MERYRASRFNSAAETTAMNSSSIRAVFIASILLMALHGSSVRIG